MRPGHTGHKGKTQICPGRCEHTHTSTYYEYMHTMRFRPMLRSLRMSGVQSIQNTFSPHDTVRQQAKGSAPATPRALDTQRPAAHATQFPGAVT